MHEAGRTAPAGDWLPLDVAKWLSSLLASAATFYAVGYLIIHAYVSSTRLQAAFWFTESFYREAGAAFLIDLLMSVALLPHVFLVLSALLIALFPVAEPGGLRHIGYNGFHFRLWLVVDPVLRRRAFYAVVALGGLLTVATLRDCELLGCGLNAMPKSFLAFWWVLGDEALQRWTERRPLMQASALFFAVSIPTVVALGALTWQVLQAQLAPPAAGRAAAREAHPLSALLLAAAFAVLMVFVPVGYGAQFYDFVAAPLADARRCIESEKVGGSTTSHGNACFLLARFDTRYILIGKELLVTEPGDRAVAAAAAGASAASGPVAQVELTRQRIYIRQFVGDKGMEPFSIDAMGSLPVRTLLKVEDPR